VEIQTGAQLRRTITSPVALIALLIVVAGAAIAGGIAAGGTVALIAAAGAALFWFLTVLGVAIRRAQNAFYAAYAEQRGLPILPRKSIAGPYPQSIRRRKLRKSISDP
jgi:hypothetical protein